MSDPSSAPAAQGSYDRGRRMHLSARTAVLVTLAVVVFAGFNYVAFRRHARLDLTLLGRFTLSEKTLRVLADLDRKVTFHLLFHPADPPSPHNASSVIEVAQRVRDLFREYRQHTHLIEVVEYDVDRQLSEVSGLRRRYRVLSNQILAVAGDSYKSVSLPDLVAISPPNLFQSQPEIRAFKAEEAITSAIATVLSGKRYRVYVTTGHDELSLGKLIGVRTDMAQDPVEFKELSLAASGKVPGDCDVLMIAGARLPLARTSGADEVKMVEDYLARGGRLLLLLRPGGASGLEDLARRWGIEVRDDMVLDVQTGVIGGFRRGVMSDIIYVDGYSHDHPITRRFAGRRLQAWLPACRSLRSAGRKDTLVDWLLYTGDLGRSWTNYRDGPRAPRHYGFKGKLILAASARRKLGEGGKKEARLVVVGSADWLQQRFWRRGVNPDLFAAMLWWLVEREQLIGIAPRTEATRRVSIPSGEQANLAIACVLLGPLVVFSLGVFVYLLRRD